MLLSLRKEAVVSNVSNALLYSKLLVIKQLDLPLLSLLNLVRSASCVPTVLKPRLGSV